MKLTREEIADLADCVMGDMGDMRQLAKQLLAEMDKPSVWTDAPEWATQAWILWYGKDGQVGRSKAYTRELPKSRERQIAEEYFELEAAIGFCELALLKYKAELEAGR